MAQEPPSFARDVAPILANYCYGCHASGVRMGGLELDTHEKLLKGGSHGIAIVPGNRAESRIYQMLTAKIQPAMPMDGRRLTSGELEIIGKWIDGGAKAPKPHEMTATTAAPKLKGVVKSQVYSLAWSPDGKLIALGGFREVRLGSDSAPPLGGHADAIRALAFSPDGKRLAAAGGLPARKGEVIVWDISERKIVTRVDGHSDCIYGVAFSPDGKTIATASYDKLIKLWDSGTGKEIRTLKDHIDAVYAVAFTPDGKRLVSGGADRTVKVWDAATGERLYTFSEPLDGINAIAIDPSGRRVAAGGLDKTIRIWSLGEKGGELLSSLIAHEDAILQLAWSPDGNTIVSCSADKTIKLFDARDLKETRAIASQPDWVMALRFSPDGRKFAAGRYDGSLTVYEVAR